MYSELNKSKMSKMQYNFHPQIHISTGSLSGFSTRIYDMIWYTKHLKVYFVWGLSPPIRHIVRR